MNLRNGVRLDSGLDEFISHCKNRNLSQDCWGRGAGELEGFTFGKNDDAETQRTPRAEKRKRSLLVAVEGKEELLAFVNAVGVRDFGIGLHYAAPGCGSPVLGLRDLC